jgi:G3E family GTPase
MKHIAIALVLGADGAGKSTLVHAQLSRAGTRRVTRVSASSVSEVNRELSRIVSTSDIDHAIVEAGNGLDIVAGRPSRAGSRFETPDTVVECVCIVSVVDGTRFLRDLVYEEHVIADGSVRVESHAMTLTRQVEACQVIAVTKTDLVPRTDLDVLLAVLSELNPTARVVIAQHGRVPSLDVFDRSQVEVARAFRGLSRNDVLDSAARERALMGISSYVYRARYPFHPERLYAHVHRPWPGVLRSRGIFWLATRMEDAGIWSQAGSKWETSRGFWWDELDPDDSPRPGSMKMRDECREHLGDRRQELTLIGLELDPRSLKAAFDTCLLSPAELAKGTDVWRALPDPFPPWSPEPRTHHEPGTTRHI